VVRCCGRLTGAEPVQDPPRVLRGVEAKRRIVDEFEGARAWADSPDCPDDQRYTYTLRAGVMLDTLRLLASEWSTHPAYRTEWTP
jgi:hypothetical protein